jgi:hypothetical protein
MLGLCELDFGKGIVFCSQKTIPDYLPMRTCRVSSAELKSPKISTERGRATDRRLVFENILVSIRSNIDTFSKTSDLNCR